MKRWIVVQYDPRGVRHRAAAASEATIVKADDAVAAIRSIATPDGLYSAHELPDDPALVRSTLTFDAEPVPA